VTRVLTERQLAWTLVGKPKPKRPLHREATAAEENALIAPVATLRQRELKAAFLARQARR
jgi:hypothetical protein